MPISAVQPLVGDAARGFARAAGHDRFVFANKLPSGSRGFSSYAGQLAAGIDAIREGRRGASEDTLRATMAGLVGSNSGLSRGIAQLDTAGLGTIYHEQWEDIPRLKLSGSVRAAAEAADLLRGARESLTRGLAEGADPIASAKEAIALLDEGTHVLFTREGQLEQVAAALQLLGHSEDRLPEAIPARATLLRASDAYRNQRKMLTFVSRNPDATSAGEIHAQQVAARAAMDEIVGIVDPWPSEPWVDGAPRDDHQLALFDAMVRVDRRSDSLRELARVLGED